MPSRVSPGKWLRADLAAHPRMVKILVVPAAPRMNLSMANC
jgi:hypothetical protein